MRLPAFLVRLTDVQAAVLLGALAALTRWAVRGRSLYSWDSGTLNAGIRSYDFASGAPHPPFYPVSIGLGKVAALAVGSVDAFVVLSVLASGVMVAFTYLLAREFASRRIALAAAAILLLSPLALFNGSVALSYALEGASSVWVAWAAWKARHNAPGWWSVHLGVAASLAVGIRPSSLFFLAPLVVWAMWRSGARWLRTVGAGFATSLAWGIPALIAGGGWADFRKYNAHQTRRVILHEPAWERPGVVWENLEKVATHLRWELLFFVAVAVVAVAGLRLLVRQWPHETPLLGFLACWVLPAASFYVLVYSGWPIWPSGYLMVLLPPMALAAALVLGLVAQGLAVLPRPTLRRAGTVAVAAVLVLPAAWVLHWDEAMEPQRKVEAWEARFDGMERSFPPESTAILTFYAWASMRNGHPDYLMWQVQPYVAANESLMVQVAQWEEGRIDREEFANALDGMDDPPHRIPAHIERVLIITGHPTGNSPRMVHRDVPLYEVRLPSGARVQAFDTAGYATIEQALRWFGDDGLLSWEDWPALGIKDLPAVGNGTVPPVQPTGDGAGAAGSEPEGTPVTAPDAGADEVASASTATGTPPV